MCVNPLDKHNRELRISCACYYSVYAQAVSSNIRHAICFCNTLSNATSHKYIHSIHQNSIVSRNTTRPLIRPDMQIHSYSAVEKIVLFLEVIFLLNWPMKSCHYKVTGGMKAEHCLVGTFLNAFYTKIATL